MKITMVMVESLDGIISRNPLEDEKKWTSMEDQLHLLKMVENCDCVITGRKSFFGKIKDKPYYVMSKTKRTSASDQREKIYYTNQCPSQILERIKLNGFEKILLLGGSEVNTVFLKEKLVDEIVLTIEPKIFGTGKSLTSQPMEVDLVLNNVEIMNSKGTLLVNYEVIKNP